MTQELYDLEEESMEAERRRLLAEQLGGVWRDSDGGQVRVATEGSHSFAYRLLVYPSRCRSPKCGRCLT